MSVLAMGSNSVSTLADSCIRRELRELGRVEVVPSPQDGPRVELNVVAIRQELADGRLSDEASIVVYAQVLPLMAQLSKPFTFQEERGMWWQTGTYHAFDDMCRRIVATIDVALLENIRTTGTSKQ